MAAEVTQKISPLLDSDADETQPLGASIEPTCEQQVRLKIDVTPSSHVKNILTNASNLATRRRSARIVDNPRELRQHLLSLDSLLEVAAQGGASDLLLKVGQVPMFRLNGELYPLRDGQRIDRALIETMAGGVLDSEQLSGLEALIDVDASYVSPKAGRVRLNIFRQRGELGMVVRLIPADIPTIDSLNLSPVIKGISEFRRGLILVTGATGSGKTTTLAAIVDQINRTRTSHIITIEDPVEFVHVDRRSMLNQRELGLDTKSFAAALKSALRQNPDVILVGELRDAETVEVALQAADTGHLVLSTVHTNDAADALSKIFGLLGSAKEGIARTQVAENLRAVISQRLVRRADQKGRIAAQEILINTATIRERILKGDPPSVLRDFIAQGSNYGMQTFDGHLFQLYCDGVVEYEEAWLNATNREDFDLRCRGVNTGFAG